MLSALDYALLHFFPFLLWECLGADDLAEGLACDGCGGCVDCHLFAVAAVGAAVDYFVGGDVEVLGELVLEACAVEGGKGCDLRGFEARIEKGDEAGDVGGVEDYDYVLNVGAVLAYVLAELFGDECVAFEEVFAGHAGLAGGAAGGYDVFGVLECFGDVGGICEVYAGEGAVVELFGDAFESGSVGVVEADVGCEVHHHGCLGHVGAYHAGCTDDDELVVSEKVHGVCLC